MTQAFNQKMPITHHFFPNYLPILRNLIKSICKFKFFYTRLYQETWSIIIAFHNKRSPCCGLGWCLTQLESWNYWTQRDIPWSIGLDHLTQSHDTLALLTPSDWFLPIIILFTSSSLIITGHADRTGQVTWPSCCRVDNAEARLGLFDSVK